jgi:putative phage-type endonuclease
MTLANAAGSAEWHDERRRGIGASDVPAIAGISTWQAPIDIWQAKLGLVQPPEDSALTSWGRILEAPIADEAERVTGRKFRRLSRAVKYRDWPILFAHLDRTSTDAILEVKSSMQTRGWGETGSADVPDHVALQVQAQLACADKETAIVAALIGYRDFRWFEVPRDRELFEDHIMPLLREFWTLVETETPPEPDGSEEFGRYLRRRYATDDGTARAATPEEQLLASELVRVKAAKHAAEIKEEELVQRLQASMGDAGRLDGPGWHATWKQSKASMRTDWKSIADGLLRQQDDEVASFLVSTHSEMRPGSRPFLFKVHEEGTDD